MKSKKKASSRRGASRGKASARPSRQQKSPNFAGTSLQRQQIDPRKSSRRSVAHIETPDRRVSVEAEDKSSKEARAKAAITPTLRFSPFLDVVIRRASQEAASVISKRIYRDAIHLHPADPNILLVTPPCQRCKRLKRSCDRAGWTCSACVSSQTSCSRTDRWQFFDAVTGKRIRDGAQHPTDDRNDMTNATQETGEQETGEPQIHCSSWASSLDEMRECDPYCPQKGNPLATSKFGAITALLLDRLKLQGSSQPERLVADLSGDTGIFEKLQMAHVAAAPLRIYYLFRESTRSCTVHDDSVANVRVFFVGICTISHIERQRDALTEISLMLNKANSLSFPEKALTEAAPHTSDQHHLGGRGETFLGFGCKVCGRVNRKTSWRSATCEHCSTSTVFQDHSILESLSRGRKMELSFTGARSDLGQANVLLTDDDLAERSVFNFSDGTRVCNYHFVDPDAHLASSSADKLKDVFSTLHHVLEPGRPDTSSFETLFSPATPLQRLSPGVERKLRAHGYVLSFGQVQGACAGIAEQQLSFSLASEGLVRQIANIRRSCQYVACATDVVAGLYKPLGCILLLLQDGHLRMDRSFFPATSAQFGLVSLAEPTVVSFRRDRPRETSTAEAMERGPKDMSLGSFVMQPQDALIARTDLLEAVELELTASGISLWMIVHFATETTGSVSSQPKPQANGRQEPEIHPVVEHHGCPWNL